MKLALHLLCIPALTAAVTIALLPAPAHANGRVVRFDRQVAGAYEIALGTSPPSPGVGNLHLSMIVSDAATKIYVLDADVVVTGKGPEGGSAEIGPIEAQPSLLDTGFYEVNTSVDSEGLWTFTILVSGDLGEASADFTVEVLNTSPIIGLVTLGVLLAFLTVLGLSVRRLMSKKSGTARR